MTVSAHLSAFANAHLPKAPNYCWKQMHSSAASAYLLSVPFDSLPGYTHTHTHTQRIREQSEVTRGKKRANELEAKVNLFDLIDTKISTTTTWSEPKANLAAASFLVGRQIVHRTARLLLLLSISGFTCARSELEVVAAAPYGRGPCCAVFEFRTPRTSTRQWQPGNNNNKIVMSADAPGKSRQHFPTITLLPRVCFVETQQTLEELILGLMVSDSCSGARSSLMHGRFV